MSMFFYRVFRDFSEVLGNYDLWGKDKHPPHQKPASDTFLLSDPETAGIRNSKSKERVTRKVLCYKRFNEQTENYKEGSQKEI